MSALKHFETFLPEFYKVFLLFIHMLSQAEVRMDHGKLYLGLQISISPPYTYPTYLNGPLLRKIVDTAFDPVSPVGEPSSPVGYESMRSGLT